MWGAVVGAALSLILLHLLYRLELSRVGIRVLLSGAWREPRVLRTLAIPPLFNGLMVSPVVWTTNAMLVKLPAGYDGIGVFKAANQWRTMPMFVPSMVLAPHGDPDFLRNPGEERLWG